MANGPTLFDQLSDPNNPLRQREWNAFLERRSMLLDDILTKLNLGASLDGVVEDPAGALDMIAIGDAIERARNAEIESSMKPEDMRQRDYQQLIGAASLYGVESPEDLPLAELQQILEEARVRRRTDSDPDQEELLAQVALTYGNPDDPRGPSFGSWTPAYIGGVDALMRTAETLPFLGRWVSDRQSTQEINRWLGALREAHIGGMDESELMGATLKEVGGGIVAYTAPGIAAWRIAGGLMGAAGIGGVTKASTTIRGREILQRPAEVWGLAARNPILHRSIQGGSAAVLLEAGGDGPISEKALNIGLGIGLGTAFEIGGRPAAAAFGGTVGGIMGASVDAPLEGIVGGIAAGLGAHRIYRGFSRSSGLNEGKHSTWFDVSNADTPLQLPRGNFSRAPDIPRGSGLLPDGGPAGFLPEPPPQQIGPPRTPLRIGGEVEPRGLPAAPEGIPAARQLPAESAQTQAIDQFTYRGTRKFFTSSNRDPQELINEWAILEDSGPDAFPNRGFQKHILLDNTGRLLPGSKHIHEVEATFDNLFVVTPESAPLYRQLVGEAQILPEIQANLRNRGFDGIAVQGIDDVIEMAGLDVAAEQLGLPSTLLQDQVIAFGTPYQVKFSRRVVDGDLLDETFREFGGQAGREVAGVQAATLSREAAKQLRPFVVGEAKVQAPAPPQWISEQRGVRFLRSEGDRHPLVPDEIKSAILQHHEEFGPRVVLLNSERIARQTIPVGSMDEGGQVLARMGFQQMDPNFEQEAVRLAHQMSNGDLAVNNSFLDVLGQVEGPTTLDLAAIAYADNPGRIAVINGDIPDRNVLAQQIREIAERYGQVIDPKHVRFLEGPHGRAIAVGPPELLTPKMVKQYEEFGMFSGMEAFTTDGAAVRVNSVWREGAEGTGVAPEIVGMGKNAATVGDRFQIDKYSRGDMVAGLRLPDDGFVVIDHETVTPHGPFESLDAGIQHLRETFPTFMDPKPGRVRASISPIFSDIKATVPAEYVNPGRVSVQQPLTGDSFNKFSKYAVREFNKEAKEAGIPVARDITDERVLSLVDRYIDEYTDAAGLVTPYDKGRFADSLEWNLAGAIRKAAGEEGDFFERVLREEAASITRATVKGEAPLPDLEELAVSKGFIWEPPWRGKHGQLVDQRGNTVIPFGNRESARLFLKNFQREQPDLTPDNAAVVNAFSGFGNMGAKSGNGVEFVSEAAEIRDLEGTLLKAASDADQHVKDSKLAVEIMGMMEEVESAHLERVLVTPPPGGEGPPPPPTGRSGPPARVPDDDSGDEFVQRAVAIIEQNRALPPGTNTRGEVEEMIKQIKDLGLDKIKEFSELRNSFLIRWSAPVRQATAIFDDFLKKHGIERPTMWRDFSAVLDGKSVATNAAEPWLGELRGILARIPRGDRRKGPLYDAVTADETTRQNMALSTEMREVIRDLRDLLDRLHAEAADFADIGYITDYLPRLRYFLDLHADDGLTAWANHLPKELQWFALYARDGNLPAYQKDVGRVLETYIRGLMFEKHVRMPFERVKARWVDSDLPTPIKQYADNFLWVARHGHPQGHDSMIRASTSFANKILPLVSKGTRVTEAEVMQFFGGLGTLQYRNLLGNSPRTNIREFYQPMLAAPEIGVGTMASAYTRFLGDASVRREWTERALRYGWAEPNRNAVANSEFFTGELRDVSGRHAFSPETVAARERWATRFDALYDRLPDRLKGGIEGIPGLDPLWAYRKFATNPGRIIAGNAGYENTMNALTRWQRGEISFADMMSQSDAINKRWSVRQEVRERALAGDLEGAAAIMGRESASTQFFFGIAEQSEGIRQAGMAGRMGMQFGNFSNQYWWKVATEMKHRVGANKLKYAAVLGALAFMPEIVGREIGWNESRRFNWFRSVGFAGGTWVDPMMNLFYSNAAVRKAITGDPLSPEEQFALGRAKAQWGALAKTFTGEVGEGLAGHAGTARTALGYLNAFLSDKPLEAVFRMTITGTGDDAINERMLMDFERDFQSELEGAFRQSAPAQGITEAEWDEFLHVLDSLGQESIGGGARD